MHQRRDITRRDVCAADASATVAAGAAAEGEAAAPKEATHCDDATPPEEANAQHFEGNEDEGVRCDVRDVEVDQAGKRSAEVDKEELQNTVLRPVISRQLRVDLAFVHPHVTKCDA